MLHGEVPRASSFEARVSYRLQGQGALSLPGPLGTSDFGEDLRAIPKPAIPKLGFAAAVPRLGAPK